MPTNTERIAALEATVATLTQQVSSLRSVIWPPEPPGPVDRIGHLEEDLAKLQKVHDTHAHPTMPFQWDCLAPGIAPADPRPAGPGVLVTVLKDRLAMARVWQAGELPDGWPTSGMPEHFCEFYLGPGVHRVQPSLVPQCVRDQFEDGAFDAIDIAVSYGETAPWTESSWRHYDHNPRPDGD